MQAHERIELSDDERYKKIFRLLNEHNLRANVFGNFSVERAFEVRMLSVDGRFRGQGIAKELVRRSETIARDFDFKASENSNFYFFLILLWNIFYIIILNIKKKIIKKCIVYFS